CARIPAALIAATGPVFDCW
nr:immunoglobulin heavy chain junction region [Macaca mulatta]MOW78821.1 immunoglobulin heavy chain junction region [Macaca mulatta]